MFSLIRITMVAVALIAACPTASAQSSEQDVDKLLRRGVELRKKGRDADALQVFREAYESSKSAHAEAQMGLAEQALGDWQPADAHLTEALASSDPWIARNRKALEDARVVIEQHLGTLTVVGGPAGAEIAIDGRPLGALPLDHPIRVLPGEHRIEVHKEGFQPFTTSPVAVAGSNVSVPVVLTAVESAEVSKPPPPAAAPIEQRHRSRRGLWIGLGVGAGAVAVITAIVLGVTLSGSTDFAANARTSCQSPCMVFTVK